MYIIQITALYFTESDEDQCRMIVEKIYALWAVTPLSSAELVITVNTWIGVLREKISLVESE